METTPNITLTTETRRLALIEKFNAELLALENEAFKGPAFVCGNGAFWVEPSPDWKKTGMYHVHKLTKQNTKGKLFYTFDEKLKNKEKFPGIYMFYTPEQYLLPQVSLK